MNKSTLVFTAVISVMSMTAQASSDSTFFGFVGSKKTAKAPEPVAVVAAETPTPKIKIATNTPKKSIAKAQQAAASPAKPAPLPIYYGPGLCANSEQYECVKIGRGDSWDSLFPDENQRDLVQRVNRSYNALWLGKVIAVPRNLKTVTLIDLAPFPHQINEKEKQIIVDQDKLAWVAYDENGQLVKWGPIASGRLQCPDSPSKCLTLTGTYRIFSKEDVRCKSDIFPIGKGGAKMPYCMYFHKGFALHGSDDMPGYRASHGCVRMFVRDAKWLNESFADASSDKNNQMGTKVVVRPVTLTEMTL